MLVLVENMRASPSSPPTPTLSASSSDGHRPHGGLNTSFVRDGSHSHYPPMQAEPQYSTSAYLSFTVLVVGSNSSHSVAATSA